MEPASVGESRPGGLSADPQLGTPLPTPAAHLWSGGKRASGRRGRDALGSAAPSGRVHTRCPLSRGPNSEPPGCSDLSALRGRPASETQRRSLVFLPPLFPRMKSGGWELAGHPGSLRWGIDQVDALS